MLFLVIHWLQSLSPFNRLSVNDQSLLLEESWKDLFLLHLAQWSLSLDLMQLLTGPKAQSRAQQSSAEKDINHLLVSLK